MRLPLVLFALAIVLSGCVDTLPEQDLRIRVAVPVSKLSADILWQEYTSDRSAADDRYFGKAIVVTGTVSNGSSVAADRFVFFGQTPDRGVRAYLLDEDAPVILERAAKEPRMTLKCFCEGLDGHLVLRSCVAP
jgi:hypothetical protein